MSPVGALAVTSPWVWTSRTVAIFSGIAGLPQIDLWD